MAKRRKKFFQRINKRADDLGYRNWRKQVFARDKYKCQMPSCEGSCGVLHVHHIKTYSTNVSGRFLVSNGITLGKKCHEKIKNREKHYATMFMRIVNDKK